jgi:hypothetical protein
MIQFTFDQFWSRVSAYIARRIGVGLESLSDVDLWDYYSEEPESVEFWKGAIADAAEFAVSEQDGMDSDILSLFTRE